MLHSLFLNCFLQEFMNLVKLPKYSWAAHPDEVVIFTNEGWSRLDGVGFTILKSHHMGYSAALIWPAVFTAAGQELQRLLPPALTTDFTALAFGNGLTWDLTQADGWEDVGGLIWQHPAQYPHQAQYINDLSNKHICALRMSSDDDRIAASRDVLYMFQSSFICFLCWVTWDTEICK